MKKKSAIKPKHKELLVRTLLMKGWDLSLKFLKIFVQPPAQETRGSEEIVSTELGTGKPWFLT